MKGRKRYYIAVMVSLFLFMGVPRLYARTVITKEMAKKIFSETCSVCHGELGDGKTHAANALKPQPLNFKSPLIKEKLTEKMMITTVTDGNPGTAMVSWRYNLTPLEIRAVVRYIRASFMQVDSYPEDGMVSEDGEEGDSLYFKSNILQGKDLEKGKNIYQKNCFPCHGKDGDGKGPRHGFIFPPPRKFTDQYDMKGVDRERMIESVTKGRVGAQMMAWEGILTPQQIENVVEYIIQEFVKKK